MNCVGNEIKPWIIESKDNFESEKCNNIELLHLYAHKFD